jgi:hypothetical protein
MKSYRSGYSSRICSRGISLLPRRIPREADMLSLLIDVENNVSKKEEFSKKIEDERIRNRCNFRKVCD